MASQNVSYFLRLRERGKGLLRDKIEDRGHGKHLPIAQEYARDKAKILPAHGHVCEIDKS